MKGNGLLLSRILCALLFSFFTLSAAPALADGVRGKFNPGHYIAMNRSDKHADMVAAIRPGVKGFQRRYYWKELEPTPGDYKFDKIAADLRVAAGQGMQVVILVADKTFAKERPTPAYLKSKQYTAENTAGGYTAIRWNSYVNKRYIMLLEALGARFDSHPAFEGMAIQETSLSLRDWVLDANGYTPEKYRNALIETLQKAAAAAPNSRVFWYMNFLTRGHDYLADIADAVAGTGVVMGGPDVLPGKRTLEQRAYPLYEDFNGKMPLFGSMQFDSYSHKHSKKSADTKYWTPKQMFEFARDEMNVNYVFWSNLYWKKPWDSFTIHNAFPVMANNDSFNPNWASTSTDRDGDKLPDADEIAIGSNPDKKDSDGDGLMDGVEVRTYGTNPLLADTDGGGKEDKEEINDGTNPLKAWDDDQLTADSDGDGLSDAQEKLHGSSSKKWDTDDDGINDADEVNIYGTNPVDKNTDNDGINDRIEIEIKKTNPIDPDTDDDGLTDGEEAGASGLGTDPLKKDTDGGGRIDGVEVRNGTNPLKAWDD